MKQFHSTHLEVKKTFVEDFTTHPYEGGWADEAIFFIAIESVSGRDASLSASVELSHDGIHWAEEGTRVQGLGEEGLHFLRVSHFGNWLRLNCHITGEDAAFKLNLQLALKG